MERSGATTLKGNPLTLVGPELKSGDRAPDFETVDDRLQPVNLQSTGNNVRIFSVVPSLDTPVCDAQTKRFNEEAAKLKGVDIYTISMDLPFAQKRWCGAEGVENVGVASAHQSAKFGEDYGVLIVGGGLDRCLARAVFVIGPDGAVKYADYLNEIASEPDYEKALGAAK